MAPTKKLATWYATGAKDLLDEYLMEGIIPANTDEMSPSDAYQLSDIFMENDYEYFRGRLCIERKKFVKSQQQAPQAHTNLEHDYQIYPPSKYTSTGNVRYEGSATEFYLKLDLIPYLQKKCLDDRYCPRHLYNSREVYAEEFTLKKFREHLYQETKSRKFENYLKHKSQAKKAMMVAFLKKEAEKKVEQEKEALAKAKKKGEAQERKKALQKKKEEEKAEKARKKEEEKQKKEEAKQKKAAAAKEKKVAAAAAAAKKKKKATAAAAAAAARRRKRKQRSVRRKMKAKAETIMAR